MSERFRDHLTILRRGRTIKVRDVRPATTLLDWLRLVERTTGVKEGCAEGDCGACTVVLARQRKGKLVYDPICSCIALLGQADGAEVITVEDLAEGEALHPVQEAMVAHHGSQCGFCTPGIVMSLFALYHADGPRPSRDTVNSALAGNLCRCTGYRPIVDAALMACTGSPADRFAQEATARLKALEALQSDSDIFVGDETSFFAAPAREEHLAEILLRHPDATIVSGNTDVGLWITKELREIGKIVYLGRVAGLGEIVVSEAATTFGASASLAELEAVLGQRDPDLAELIARFASRQIRAVATIGGNIANGSPIGDLAPALIALGATLELRRGAVSRTIALEDFFIDYRKQDRLPSEYVRAIHVPHAQPNEQFRCFKVSKRRDEDISAVMGAFRFTIEDGAIISARLAFGGMAGTPKRARETEAALLGARLRDRASWDAAITALTADFTPISDHRASADYRAAVAQGLLTKALAEMAVGGTAATRLFGLREAHHAG